MLNVGYNLAVFCGGKALTGWFKWALMCLVNLLVFSTISAPRCLYYHCEVLVLSLRGACTVAARCLYYRCKVAYTTTTWCLWLHYKPHSTGTLLTNQLAEVSFKADSTTSALSLHRNYSGIRRINYY